MNETCGCCEGLETLTPLAAANRPGLDALVYRAGTHATFLETMKARLSAREYPALSDLTTRVANDPSIAMLDAWATVADVLTFYQERIANEGYLRTATERRSILELARLVGYVPRPGVAASVYLAFTLEDGYRTEVPAGTRAQSLPGPGERPQFFETSEALEARAEWNVLTPRLIRPQPLRPAPSGNGDGPSRRLYVKGVATNLEPSDPILIDFGETQEFFKAHIVEPDPEADRTLVTLRPVSSQSPAGSRTRVLIEDIRRRVDRYLDLESYGIARETRTSGRVVGLLEEWREELTRETPPQELAESLRDRVVPQVRQDLNTARVRNYYQLAPWLGDVEAGLLEIEEMLSAAALAEVGPARGSRAPVAASTAEGNGNSPSTALDGLLDRLGKPPSVQPVSAAKLPRSLEDSFGGESDAVPQLLAALQPALSRAIYRAWEQTGAPAGTARVYALRVTDSPFGHNTPLRPILGDDGNIEDYEEWTLKKTTRVSEEEVEIEAKVEWNTQREQYTFDMSIDVSDASAEIAGRTLANTTTPIRILLGEEPVALTISGVRGDSFSFTFRLAFPVRRMLVVLSHQGVIIGASGEGAGRVEPESSDESESSLLTEITVAIDDSGEFEVSSHGSDPTEVDVQRLRDVFGIVIQVEGHIQRSSTTPTEQPNVVSLGTTYKEILPDSWVVVERPPDGTEGIEQITIAPAEQVREASRADYGITAKGTQITLPETSRWIDPDRDNFAVIRGTSVYAAPELLELADAPPETVDEDGVAKVEPVEGGRIELDALYDGLESGRWLFVTGERDDLPGVRASELVMLAGVEQGVQQVRLTTADLLRFGGELPTLRLAGKGSTGPGGLDLTISARRAADGSVLGYAHHVGGAPGEVIGIVPPDDDRGFWCINVRRTDTGTNSGDQRINWYVRDTGDGRTSFDEISYVTSIGGDCEKFPAPTGSWLRLVEGDFQVTAEEPTGDRVHSTIILANDLAYPYKRESVRIYGNVVNATHGETRPEVLGSGDGSAAFQKFGLKQSPLTYVAATTPRGVESTLKVYVNDIRWHEAEHLAGLQPGDRRFITQTNDLDEVTVVFGDGQRGARLPTGVENVRAVYRTGIGKAGNVAAEQISLLATRPLGLKGVINPQPATGGADRESRDGARRNAPLGVKVLNRLVSVRDYEDFTRAFAGIGKASAARLSEGRLQLVHLTIAGANDIPIAETSDLYRHLLQVLRRFGDPQQPIRVEVRELIPLIISAGVRLLPDYLWELVERQIRASVLETFGFEQRELGQDALLSEVISTIQHVPGVSYVDVDTFGGIPEETVDATSGLRRPLLPSEIEVEITRLTQSADQPLQRVRVDLAGSDGSSIHPAQLAFLTPQVPDTLILKEITA